MDRTISYHLENVEDEFNVKFKLMTESLDLEIATQVLDVVICFIKYLIIKFRIDKLKNC